jgi:hypothetical protein
MRMLLKVKFPHKEFNEAVRNGSVGQTVRRILAESKPEAVYFTEQEGQRSVILIVDLPDPSKVPSLAEPWFLAFNADVEFHIVMAPEELQKAGLEDLGKKWS